MTRILIKGGVWKNTEDEILKAAVMKYGKHQWARISSLLTRKTPKQCKARWFEWLDPSIKKTDWSREEDEKLLHLAKLMPTQWRTIAPIVGRTPAQCLERYQYLLDEADVGDKITADSIRKLRPGEIDPNPETKPARPDPVDMDEDEKEMLSEARARLANTQGKKAKRKARQKQLEEARRLSNASKRRELKKAGLELEIKKKYQYTGMDYNADIPFYRPAPAGFWDINEERLREASEKRTVGVMLHELEGGKRRADIEMEERKKDYKKQKKNKEEGKMPPPNLAAFDSQVSSRKKLILPAPQVQIADVEELVKMGASGVSTRELVLGDMSETPSSSILGSYTDINAPTPQRTRRIQTPGGDNGADADLRLAARNLKAVSTAATPLSGDVINVEGSLYDKEQVGIPMTPNALVNSNNKGKTPIRDAMGINATPLSSFGGTPRVLNSGGSSLSSLFKKLPKPKNDFEIVLPEIDADVTIESDSIIEDQEEAIKREEQSEAERMAFELRQRSQVLQLGLPRPVLTDEQLFKIYGNDDNDENAEKMIAREKAKIILHDSKRYPFASQHMLEIKLPPLDDLTEYLESAKLLIDREIGMREEFEIPLRGINFQINPIDQSIVDKLDPEMERKEFADLKSTMKTLSIASQKVEKRLGITLGGYIHRHKLLSESFVKITKDLEQRRLDEEIFMKLRDQENYFVEVRMAAESKVLQKLSMIESDLQDRFRDLKAMQQAKGAL